jgi:hypothetical protein
MKRAILLTTLLLALAVAAYAFPPAPPGSGSMTYPSGSGIPIVSTGTSWGTTLGVGTLTDTKACTWTTASGLVCNSTMGAGTTTGTGTNHYWPYWTSATALGAKSLTASKPVCTDASGDPVVCAGTEGVWQVYNSNLTGINQALDSAANPSFSTINVVGANSLNLGTAGTNVGGIRFKNATSGYVEILPPTGVLGTGAITLPASGILATTGDLASYLPLTGGTMTGATIFDPTVTGTLLDFRLATEWTGGTLLNAAFASGVTPAANILGVALDFNTNLTMTATKNITGYQVKMPAFTQSSANTTTYIGYDLPTAGALISQNNASSIINWTGLNIQMPNITQTQGATNSYGVYINGGTVTSGTQYSLFVDSGNVRLDGSLGDTTNRVVKGWFIDAEITNIPTVNGVAGNATNGLVTNPMTAAGDLITGGASGVSTGKIAAVAAKQPLLSGGVATASAYAGYTFEGTAAATYTFPGATSTLLATTGSPAAMVIASQATGDILYATSATAWGRLGKGANNSFLAYNNSGNLVWATTLSLDDSAAQFYGSADATKTLKLLVSNATTGADLTLDFKATSDKTIIFPDPTTGDSVAYGNVALRFTTGGSTARVITVPDAAITVARTDAANTFTGHQTIEGVTSTGATGTGNFVFDGTPTLVTPVIGAATGTSLLATGRVDGLVGVTITTDATTISSTSNKQAYYINNGDSAAKGIYTLPTAAAGLQYCIALYSEHATGATAVMKFQTSASGQYIALDGVRTASGGLIKSTGAAGDAACVVGISATEWIAYHSSGTWSKD